MEKDQKEFVIQLLIRSNKAYSGISGSVKGKEVVSREEASKMVDDFWVRYLAGEDISELDNHPKYPGKKELLDRIDEKGSLMFREKPDTELYEHIRLELDKMVTDGTLKYMVITKGFWPFKSQYRKYSRV